MSEALDDAIARLDDYVRGQHADADVQDYEADLFSRAITGAAPELSFHAALGNTLRAMRDTGTLNLWLTARQAKAILASGARVASLNIDPKNMVLVDLATADVELIVVRIPLPLAGIKQLDVEVSTPEGKLLKTMPEVAFDAEEGAVYACCEIDLARASSGVSSVTRVFGTDEHGRRELAMIPFGF